MLNYLYLGSVLSARERATEASALVFCYPEEARVQMMRTKFVKNAVVKLKKAKRGRECPQVNRRNPQRCFCKYTISKKIMVERSVKDKRLAMWRDEGYRKVL